MTNPVLDNNIATESVILWQYDKAYNLIRLIKAWNRFAEVSCTDFWDYFGNSIFPIDLADTFGLNVWGNLLGISRPTIYIPIGSDGRSDLATDDYDEDGYRVYSVDDVKGWKTVSITNTLYRGLLKGQFFLMCHKPTVPNYNKYLSIVFGAEDSDESDAVAYDIFDSDGNVKNDDTGYRYTTRNRVIDFQDMTMSFTFPENASIEEAYLIFQHYDLVYKFPAGIRYPGEFINDELVIGLNTTPSNGQFYKAFVDGLVLAEDNKPDNYPNGGIFSTTDRANYLVPAVVSGKVFIYNSVTEYNGVYNYDDSSDSSDIGVEVSLTVSIKNSAPSKRHAVWIDWGNGDCGYKYIPQGESSKTFSSIFYHKGLFPVMVLFDEKVIESVTPGFSYEHLYDLSVAGGAE